MDVRADRMRVESRSLSRLAAPEQTLNLVIYFGVSYKLLRPGRPLAATAFKVINLAGCALYHPTTARPPSVLFSPVVEQATPACPTVAAGTTENRRVNSNHVYANRPANVVLSHNVRLLSRPYFCLNPLPVIPGLGFQGQSPGLVQ